MSEQILSSFKKHMNRSSRPMTAGLAAIILFFFAVGLVSYWNINSISQNSQRILHTNETLSVLDDVLSTMKDAETGQRGFLITGDEKYLAPYTAALANIEISLADLDRLIRSNPDQASRVSVIATHVHAKLDELNETITLRREQGFEAARSVVISDRGKNEMDMIRSQIGAIRQDEQSQRTKRLAETEASYKVALISGLLTALLGLLLSGAVSYVVRRSTATQQRQDWLRSGQVGLSAVILGEQRVEQLGENIIRYLAEYLDAHAGAFFAKDGDGFRRVATYGVPEGSEIPIHINLNDGILGQAAKDRRTFLLNDMPDGYLTFGSSLGRAKPQHLIIFPAVTDNLVKAVIELGFIHKLDPLTVSFVEQVSESIAIAIRSARYRANMHNLLEETQRQTEELQAQGEELRVTNEELEEQGRVLKESQAHLEQQQAELEQTNAQLEEQAKLLEDQRDDIARSKAEVQLKAQELEQASQYKSDFLANMSHELRTPLNSSLILSKLLADNQQKNLTEEQVQFARTIESSGNDLLTLINDILDLSKIEAGHMDIRLEPTLLSQLAKNLTRVFEPVAAQKNLTFSVSINPGTPDRLETDPQRLEQILKNLISNAIKFTEKGSVTLTISHAAERRITFAVSDTGIGIAPEQQQAIFEAFRQADGTINRKYGGTGLGLSISREFGRLLGADIRLVSELGKGSTFIVTIAEEFDPARVAPRQSAALAGATHTAAALPMPKPDTAAKPVSRRASHRFQDDRDRLKPGNHSILVVEDDEGFARILYDMAHELSFNCFVAGDAEEALNVATHYLPSAIVLDVGLPDHSGLSVLDRLKRDVRTRHIPVHVVSAGDHAQTALSLGAIGYMLKPVKREQLVTVLKQFESRLTRRVKHVLIVEDDAVQRESMSKLLASHDVKTTMVGTAAECLEQLKNGGFDCMVLDLSLPDASGYALLETLSREDMYSFPPVIVYTGRDLSTSQEQQLRRYSKSIIIKGAKSPERLLDEVTLFLHQVVADLPAEQRQMLENVKNRDSVLEGRRILAVEDDVRNVYALTSIFEPLGAIVKIARNGREALQALEQSMGDLSSVIDLVLMDVMMPEMDGLTATREIRKNTKWKNLPIIMLTAKAMQDDQKKCLDAGANDYMAKPLDVEKLLSLVRVWMPR